MKIFKIHCQMNALLTISNNIFLIIIILIYQFIIVLFKKNKGNVRNNRDRNIEYNLMSGQY